MPLMDGTMSPATTSSFYNPVSAMIGSHIPFIGTARRLRRALSYNALTSKDESIASDTISTTTSGSSTPLMSPRTSKDLSMTQLDTALRLSDRSAFQAGGIDWNSAMLGHQMLISASQRAQCKDDFMTRVMYIDALKYLHGGLPADLSENERQSLRVFAPSIEADQHSASYEAAQIPDQQNAPGSKLVRSSTASVVGFLIALFMLAMPLLAAFANKLLEYERKHHVAQRLVNSTEQIVRAASTKGVTLGGQLVSLTQRQTSTYAILSLLGLIHSVVDGLSDGVERSLHSQAISKEDGGKKSLCDS